MIYFLMNDKLNSTTAAVKIFCRFVWVTNYFLFILVRSLLDLSVHVLPAVCNPSILNGYITCVVGRQVKSSEVALKTRHRVTWRYGHELQEIMHKPSTIIPRRSKPSNKEPNIPFWSCISGSTGIIANFTKWHPTYTRLPEDNENVYKYRLLIQFP